MYKRVIAYPSGVVKYYYTDKVVTEGKDGIPKITLKIYKKEPYGLLDMVSVDISQPRMDQLL